MSRPDPDFMSAQVVLRAWISREEYSLSCEENSRALMTIRALLAHFQVGAAAERLTDWIDAHLGCVHHPPMLDFDTRQLVIALEDAVRREISAAIALGAESIRTQDD